MQNQIIKPMNFATDFYIYVLFQWQAIIIPKINQIKPH